MQQDWQNNAVPALPDSRSRCPWIIERTPLRNTAARRANARRRCSQHRLTKRYGVVTSDPSALPGVWKVRVSTVRGACIRDDSLLRAPPAAIGHQTGGANLVVACRYPGKSVTECHHRNATAMSLDKETKRFRQTGRALMQAGRSAAPVPATDHLILRATRSCKQHQRQPKHRRVATSAACALATLLIALQTRAHTALAASSALRCTQAHSQPHSRAKPSPRPPDSKGCPM
jgi:hypothetical protein